MIVRKGTASLITESHVTVQLDEPFGGRREIQFSRNGSSYRIGTGDRVVWWPVWESRIERETWTTREGHIFERLVREADLSSEEAKVVSSLIENEREHQRAEARYQEMLRADRAATPRTAGRTPPARS